MRGSNIGSIDNGQKNTLPSIFSALNLVSKASRSKSTYVSTTNVGIQKPLAVPGGSGFSFTGKAARALLYDSKMDRLRAISSSTRSTWPQPMAAWRLDILYLNPTQDAQNCLDSPRARP